MASPPQNSGSDAEDGELTASEDETVGKDDAKESSTTSALPAGQGEEENGEDQSPQRKVFANKKCISILFQPHPLYFKLPQFLPKHMFSPCCVASSFPYARDAFKPILLMLAVSCAGYF